LLGHFLAKWPIMKHSKHLLELSFPWAEAFCIG
jgi:hypothetical protein